MQEIPKWIIEVIDEEKLTCRQCKGDFKSNNLMSIGIQESSKSPHNDYLSIGLFCRECKELMIFELKPMTLIDFSFEILEQETSNRIKKKSKEDTPAMVSDRGKKKIKRLMSQKSRITSKEVDDVRKFLKPKDLSYDDILSAMGMLPEDIKRYNSKEEK